MKKKNDLKMLKMQKKTTCEFGDKIIELYFIVEYL